MTLDEFTAQIRPILEQVHELEAAIPLAVYAPASVAADVARRDELMRQAEALCIEYGEGQ